MIILKPTFPFYGLIIILSIVVGIIYVLFSLRKEHLLKKELGLFFIIYFLLLCFFAKLFTVIASSFKMTFWNAGFSSYGGLIGIVLSAIIFEKILSFKGKLIKYVIISLPLIYGLSKIACFIAGCCYGIPYNGFMSITYPDGLNISLFPIQLVETIVSLIIFIICHINKDKIYINEITLILVSIVKFSLDFLRYDHLNVSITFNQGFSIVLFFIVGFILIRKKVLK